MVFVLCVETVSAVPDEDPVAPKKAKKTIPVIVKVADSDNDGVPDDIDECPNIPGNAATKGCPDTDGDGIPDHKDDCPTIAGIAQFKGCPDTDLDGIPDNKDVCPYEAGPASNNGCPISEKNDKTHVLKGTRLIDTISLDEERDMQIMRYERYIAEQELKRQEYITQLSRDSKPDAEMYVDEKKPIEIEKNKVENPEKDKVAVVTPTPVNPLTTFSTVKIDNAMYLSYKPQIETLLKDMRFQDGRVYFIDENKFFDALYKLASYCNTYPEWTLIFHCYSNETDNAYGNKQLFSNRVHVMKQILVDDLHVPSQKLSFVNSISHTSEVSNFISLDITVK
jgi:hypothetical protein